MSKRRKRRPRAEHRTQNGPRDEMPPDRRADYEATVAFNEVDRSDPNGRMLADITPLRDLYISGAIDVETFEALLDAELSERAA